jgi:hypothetical protein
VSPRLTDCAVGLTESEKSGDTPVTVTLAVPCTLLLAAVTVNVPVVAPAVNRPDESIVLSPVTDQVMGWGSIGWPYWSLPVALNCCVPPVWTDALTGETVIVLSTGGALAAAAMLPRPVGPSQPAPEVHSTDGLHDPFEPEVTSKYGVPAAHATCPASVDAL